MPNFCCVVDCGNRGDRDLVRFYKIPVVVNFAHKEDLNELSKSRREKWLIAIKRDKAEFTENEIKNARVCGKHFISVYLFLSYLQPNDPEGKAAALCDPDNPDWVPSLNMGYDKHKDVEKRNAEERWDRLLERNKKLLTSSHSSPDCSTSADYLPPATFSEPDLAEEMDAAVGNTVSVQTEMTMDNLTSLFLALSRSKKLEEKLKRVELSCRALEADKTKTKYYTGMDSYSVFEWIADDLKQFIKIHHNTKLPAREQILLTFTKLRLNLDFKELAFRFDVSSTEASSYFKATVDVMYKRFKNLVMWPSRDVLLKTMPQCFKDAFHGNTSIIIDCLEIFIERPADPYSAAQCWSPYKHHETIKYLIGITPQGTISFISEGWGGRASDKMITINSKFFDLLSPGDVVLADRDFLVKEFADVFHVTFKTPAFKTQLHPVDLEETRSIASVRIHVEKVIGVLRQKFIILMGVMPISLVSSGIVDEIVFVCCALVNLCPPIVPLE